MAPEVCPKDLTEEQERLLPTPIVTYKDMERMLWIVSNNAFLRLDVGIHNRDPRSIVEIIVEDIKHYMEEQTR